jgi:hypothetical protein
LSLKASEDKDCPIDALSRIECEFMSAIRGALPNYFGNSNVIITQTEVEGGI